MSRDEVLADIEVIEDQIRALKAGEMGGPAGTTDAPERLLEQYEAVLATRRGMLAEVDQDEQRA